MVGSGSQSLGFPHQHLGHLACLSYEVIGTGRDEAGGRDGRLTTFQSGSGVSSGRLPKVLSFSRTEILTTDRLRQGFLLRRLLRLGYEGQEGFGGQDDGQVVQFLYSGS